MKMSREWAMPSADTLSIAPIMTFVEKHLEGCRVIVDPFARNSRFGTLTNDLNPETDALWHMDAADFCDMILNKGVRADAVIFDPPYSPRQVKDCYDQIGRKMTQKDGQNAMLNAACRDSIRHMLRPGGKVLSFGWSSCGFSDFEMLEILLVGHGSAHNDTICVASRKPTDFIEFEANQ